MKILFVIKQIEYIDPMGIMLLSALAKQKGHETYINVLSDNNLIDTIKKIRPDVVAFSAKTGEHKYYLAANAAIKKYDKNIFTIIGGPHTTFFPEIIDNNDINAICVGEGDDAWIELLDALEHKKDINNIQNIVTKENRAKNQAANLRPRKENLDSLPFLDRDLFYKNTRLGKFPLRAIMTSRGCPFTCAYCFNHIYNAMYLEKGNVFRRFSVDRILAELKELKQKYETQFIKFYDDVFTLQEDEWFNEFVEKYPKEIGVPFQCLLRSDLITDSMILKLKKAGLYSINMSIEVGDDKIRAEILNRHAKRENIIRGFHICDKHKVNVFCNNIYAIPPYGIEYDVKTLDMNIESKVVYAEFGLLHPYPRTEIGEYVVKKGYFDGNWNKLHMTYSSKSPFACYSEKEKMMQKNLALLSTLCVRWPWFKNIAVKYLIKLPFTPLYFIMYYLTKSYLVKTKIYPIKLPLAETIKNVFNSFFLERFKRFDEKL